MKKLSTDIYDFLGAVTHFHDSSRQPPPSPTPTDATRLLRWKLALEESDELFEANTRQKQLDALADQLYVLLGTAIAYDLDDVLVEAFWRVHAANMAKFGPGGSVREDGKVLKPPGWQPPDLSDLV